MSLSDQIAGRVNCYGIAGWLIWLAASHGKSFYDLFPIAPVSRHEVRLPQEECTLVFRHPHAGHAELADPDRWILESAMFTPSAAALPFALDARSETLESAKSKLSDDTVASRSSEKNIRISYFLDDARVVELTYLPEEKGLASVYVVRLGAERAFDEGAQ